MEKTKRTLTGLLNWTERQLKTDVRYMLRGSLWAGVGQFVSMASSFALSLAFANLISQETYGLYKYILSIAGILTIPTLSGLDQAVSQAVADGKEGTFTDAYQTKLRWGTLAGVASLVTAGYYFYHSNHELGIAFLISAIFLPIMDVFNIYGSVLQGKKDFFRNYTYYSSIQTASIICLIITLFLTHNLYLILLAYFLPVTLLRYFFLRLTLRQYHLNTVKDAKAINYGKHLSLMSVLGMVAAQADKILVFQLIGAKELAIYSFAIALPEQIRGLSKSIFNIGFPRLAALHGDELKKSLIQKTWTLTLLSLVIVVGYILLAGFVFSWFFPKYLESLWYSRLFMVGLLAIPGITMLSAYFSIEKKVSELYYLNILGGAVSIILSLIMIKNWNLTGAILKNTVYWVILLVANYIFFVRSKTTVD